MPAVLDRLDESVIREAVDYLTPQERAELDMLLAMEPEPAPEERPVWRPQPGPQTEAFNSTADEVYYGGEVGGGKSDLLLGLATQAHHRSVIFRRQSTQLDDIIERSREIIGDQAQFNGTKKVWRYPDGRIIRFGSCQLEEDKEAWRGRPHDLYAFDEATLFSETIIDFITGWNRTTIAGQRCRVVLGSNPPLTSEGEWIIRRYAAWLDPKHPNPAAPGELRWYARIDDVEVERPDGEPFEHEGKTKVPRSRTFIRAGLRDNAYLRDTGYDATIDNLPEPYRSQAKGSFIAGRKDDAYQVIPTGWVMLAQSRWEAMRTATLGQQMDCLGVDVARGGKDKLVLAPRYGTWFGPLTVEDGVNVQDGFAVKDAVAKVLGDGAQINIDILNVGNSPYDLLKADGAWITGVNNGAGSDARDKSGLLKFRNIRAESYWKLREALDPASGMEIALPPDDELRADLCAPRYSITLGGILLEPKVDIKKRLGGRSPDKADALVLASYIPHTAGVFTFRAMNPLITTIARKP